MKKIIGLGLIIVLCLDCLVGCKKDVEPTLIEFETCVGESWDRVTIAMENCDWVALEKERKTLISIQDKIEVEKGNYKEDDTEYKALESLNNVILYRIEGMGLAEEIFKNPYEAIINPTITTQLETCVDGLNEGNDMYMKYKEELGIKTDVELFNEEGELTTSDL